MGKIFDLKFMSHRQCAIEPKVNAGNIYELNSTANKKLSKYEQIRNRYKVKLGNISQSF